MNGRCNQQGVWHIGMLAFIACWAGWSPVARGQGSYDLFYIGASVPIADESGTNPLYGTSQQPGCLVQIIQVTDTNSPVEPPFNVDGTVNLNVQLLNSNAVTAIGSYTSPDLARPGIFAYQADKPSSGTKLVVRVFNAPNMYDATYYSDSAIYTVESDVDIDAAVPATTNSLDNTDTDGDGLMDRVERYFGTSISSSDSDGDGMSDGDERRAGTGMLDSTSFLALGRISILGNDVVVEWDSSPGVKYEIEYTDDLVGGEAEFNGLSKVITATDTITQYTLYGAASSTNSRQFRVILADTR